MAEPAAPSISPVTRPVAFPPQPWDLRGQLHASVFLVPPADVLAGAATELPPGWTPVRLLGRAVVGTAWVDYEPDGVLSYRELMATVLVRRGLKLVPFIVRIWVDSEASRDGGRALWAIPKDLAHFEFTGGTYSAWDEHGGIATGTVRRRLGLPRRWPVGFSVAQRRGGEAVVSPVDSTASLEVGSATLDADPTGPLGFLTGHRPWLTFTLRDFVMRFGR